MNINFDKSKIKVIKCGDGAYPKKLENIYAKPQVLYVLGNEKLLNDKSIAVIGCRDCTNYGLKNSYKFAYELARKGVCIISGLARGIDSYAHIGALKAEGKTVAVLGCGLDIVYPPENFELYKAIIKNNGAIITEYPLGTKPNLISLVNVNKISFAILYLLVRNVIPSKAIRASLPQSKNQWYPAITVCSLVNSLYTIKVSVSFTKVAIISFSFFFSASVVLFISLLSFTIFSTLFISF